MHRRLLPTCFTAALLFAAAGTLAYAQEHPQEARPPRPQQEHQREARPAQQQPQQQPQQQAPQREQHRQQENRPAQQQPQHERPAQSPPRPQRQERPPQPQQQVHQPAPAPQPEQHPQRTQQQRPQRQEQHQQPPQQARPVQQPERAREQGSRGAPSRSSQQVGRWQSQRGWLKQGGGWQGHSSWQQDRARDWRSEHRTWGQRGGYGGYFIPQDRFTISFGSQHWFRLRTRPIIVGGYPQFQYGGFTFMLVDPWPEYWSDTWYASDDVYVDYNDGYYLYNRRYPGEGLALVVVH